MTHDNAISDKIVFKLIDSLRAMVDCAICRSDIRNFPGLTECDCCVCERAAKALNLLHDLEGD